MELDKIITGDSAVVLQSFPPDCIDLTVTSPPYDNLRTYNGFTFDFETIARQLFRVTKAGGVVVWVVADETKKGTESGTSFRQALYFMQCGFNLHDTMIYNKGAQGGAKGSNYCYTQAFEYMFVFSKGKPKSINLLKDRENKYVKTGKSSMRKKNGKTVEFIASGNALSKRTNVWDIRGGWMVGSTDKIAFEHPATFPEALAQDHILSWSNENDTVLDCFCGSGTTPKIAKLLNRHYIGIDTSAEYVALTNERLAQVERGLTLPAPDGGDSAPSQALSTPDMFSAIEHEPTPAPRR